MQNSMWKKGIVLGIICLFVGASVLPSISGNIEQTGDASNLKIIENNENQEKLFGGPPEEEWIRTYFDESVSSSTIANSVIETNDNGFIFTGGYWYIVPFYDHTYWVVKTDSDGNEEWNVTQGDPETEQLSSTGHCIEQTNDDGYIITGIDYNGSYGGWDLFLLKIDEFGNKEWYKKFGKKDKLNWGNVVRQTSDDGYIVLGFRDYYLWLIKTDSDGNEEWNKTFEDIPASHPRSLSMDDIIICEDGSYIILATGTNLYNILLIKTDSSGNTSWTKSYSKFDLNFGFDIEKLNDGGYIILGRTFNSSEYPIANWLIKTDDDGNIEWDNIYYEFDYYGMGRFVKQTTDNGFIMGGCSYIDYQDKAELVKTDSTGNVEWSCNYGVSFEIAIYSGLQTNDNGFILAGDLEEGDINKACLIKVAPENGENLVADFTWTPTNPEPGETITFDASNSYDPDGYITLYEWDWDNNGLYEESHTTPITTHSWPIYGYYPVKLRVWDNDGNTDTVTKTVSICGENQPPDKPTTPTGPTNVYVGQTADYSTSTTDPEGDMIQFRFLWGDGTMSEWTDFTPSRGSVTVSKYWDKTGTFNVRAQARDSKGAKSTWSNHLPVYGSPEENRPPIKPKLITPINGMRFIPTNKKLYWTGGDRDASDTVTYDIYFGTSSSPPNVDTITSSARYKLLRWDPPGYLQYNTKYYWKIKATDNHGASSYSPVWSFTTRHESWMLDKTFEKANYKHKYIPESNYGQGEVNFNIVENRNSIFINLESEGSRIPNEDEVSKAIGILGNRYVVPYKDGGKRQVKIYSRIVWHGSFASIWDGNARLYINVKIWDCRAKEYIYDKEIYDHDYDMNLPIETVEEDTGSYNWDTIVNLNEKGMYRFEIRAYAKVTTVSWFWVLGNFDEKARLIFWPEYPDGYITYYDIKIYLK